MTACVDWYRFGFWYGFITGVCMVWLHLNFVNDILYYKWVSYLDRVGFERRDIARYYLEEAIEIPHSGWTIAGSIFKDKRRTTILRHAKISIIIVTIIQFLLFFF